MTGQKRVGMTTRSQKCSFANTARNGHEVCLDIVSKAVHCYKCDDYVLSDAPWLARIRSKLVRLETTEGGKLDMSDADETDYEEMIQVKSSNTQDTEDSPMGKMMVSPGCTGLRNLGNTCYMNSVLQMLSHCSGFRSFFRDFLRATAPVKLGEGRVQIPRQSTKHLQETIQRHDTPDSLAVTEASHALLRVVWSGMWKSIAPRSFVHAVWRHHGGLFAAHRQQDAQEFLGFVLDRLDDELRPQKQPSPVLVDLFGIDQCQEVTCHGCGSTTKLTEPLLGLFLSLPEDNKKKTKRENPLPLEACIDTLRADERLEGDNQFFCDNSKCKGKRNATKTVVLRHRPQALLLSFRRTKWNLSKGLHKDTRRVEFPLELDATNLLREEISSKTNRDEESECHYRLSSIVSHSGSTPMCGHYIAWCRVKTNGEEKWHLFNDGAVRSVSEKEVLKAEAFILMYERTTGDSAVMLDA